MNINDTNNLVILNGRVVEDFQAKSVAGGKTVANFKIATNENYKPEGATEYVNKPTFHDVTAWGQNAEYAAKNLKKGSPVEVWGKLVSNEKSVDDKDKAYYRTYVKVDVLKTMGSTVQKSEGESAEKEA